MDDNEYKTISDNAYKFHTEGKFSEAIDLYVQLLQNNDKDADILFLYAQANFALKEYDEALAAYLEVFNITKNNAVKSDIALVLYQMSKYNEAISVLESLNDKDTKSVQLLASCFRKNKNFYEAIKTYQMLGDKKDGYDYYNLAYCYTKTGNYSEAIKTYEQYLNKYPASSEIFVLMGLNAADMNEFELAIKYYDKAIALNPDDINAKQSKAAASDYLKRYDEAEKIYLEIINQGKADAQTLTSLGVSYLRHKNFYDGYKLFLNKRLITRFKMLFSEKIWTPNVDINGKNVLLYSDCGLGDTIMYVRFLNLLKQKCKSVTLQTDNCILKILGKNFPGINFISKSEPIPDYDIVASVMDIQLMLNLDFNQIGEPLPYINADKELTEKFKTEIFSSENRPKIGIFRKGNTTGLKNRFIEYSLIRELTNDKRFMFYNFQIDTDDEVTDNFVSLKQYINDFNDTAALLKNMDILVTVDTAIAHMAGSSGVKTFLMLPYSADWRWFDDTETTVWYKSIKIFKQNKFGDWRSVIKEVKSELDNYAY